MDPKLIERFKTKYRVDAEFGCWLWTASLAGKGYGQIKIPGTRRQMYAHRLSYLIHKGEIPEGKSVCHKCDNPRCVNPDHLWLGSAADNQADMKDKGRSLFGDKNARAVLTKDDVRAIRLLCGTIPQKQIGEKFGISQIEVSRIYRRLRWDCVD